MDPVSTSAGGFGADLTGLGTQSNGKKKAHVNSMYSHSLLFKKPKMSVVNNVVDLFAGSLSLKDIGGANVKPVVSWGSKIGSIFNSVSSFLDVKNIENTVAEETSYAESSKNNNMDKAMPKKTCIQTYVLGNPPKQLLFKHISNDKPFFPCSYWAQSIATIINKLMTVKKNFYYVDGFRGASTPLKFSEIIRSSFTSESSLKKTKELAVSENILANNNIKQINKYSDQEIVVKKISVNFLKLAVKSVFSKFSRIMLIKMQLVVLKDHHWTLLYTLPIGITAHDLSDLLDLYGGKTCLIGHNPSSYVCNKCVIVCFANKASKLAAIGSIPVFKGVNLHWASLFLTCCVLCKQFGHISSDCSLGGNSGVHGSQMKQAPIAHPVFFGGKTWAQVASGSPLCVVLSFSSGTGLSSSTGISSVFLVPLGNSDLYDHLVSLKHSVELLSNQVSGILKKLSFIKLVSLASSLLILLSVTSASLESGLDLNMAMNDVLMPPVLPLIGVNINMSGFSSSSFKILTTKMGGLKFKMVALDALINSVLVRLDHLCSGLGLDMNNSVKQTDIIHWHKKVNNLISIVTETKLKDKVFISSLDSSYLGFGIAIIMDNSLVRHVYKISEISGQLFSFKLLFKNKLFVLILGLYAGVFSVVQFFQTGNINSMIAKAVNKFFFIVLDGNFNENGSYKCTSFKKCLDLGLVNFLGKSFYVRTPTWTNSWDMAKIIDFLFVSSNLVNAVVDYNIFDVGEFFDTDHQTVSVLVGLSGLLDM
ncbi:hypothetical protein G9A89_005270 [Geosiphon pyriformis]|nr:hypothetical protein G9A89_005270 [Geosiphon pyriformis]